MIYIHIPFCKSFCTYCGFYSVIPESVGYGEPESCADSGSRNDIGDLQCRDSDGRSECELLQYHRFCDALCRELLLRKDEIAAANSCNTLYLGGGTPSVLPLDCISQIASSARKLCGTERFLEFTMEMNPDDIVRGGVEWAESLRSIGVSRASVGIQSFDDVVLRKMNRRHDAQTAVNAYHILEEAGFDNISVDLIFGLPSWFSPFEKDLDRLRRDIDCALSLSSSGTPPKHISAYQLSVEPDSSLEALMKKDSSISEAPQEICASQYGLLCEALSNAGYEHYEISNFAQPGYEAVHNSAYWSYLPYAGFGPAAHSFCVIPSSPSSPSTPDSSRQQNPVSPARQQVQTHSQSPQSSSERSATSCGVKYIRKWNVSDVEKWSCSLLKGPRLSDASRHRTESCRPQDTPLAAPRQESSDYEILTPEQVIPDTLEWKLQDYEILTPEQVAEERIMLALRTSRGISYKCLIDSGDSEAIERAVRDGALVATENGNLRIPEKYFFISDNIISSLFR